MDCRTSKTRVKIVKDYFIKPMGIYKVLGGTVRSCAKADINDYYYRFCYIKKNNKYDKGIMNCGNGAGKHFLKLIGMENIPTFDPLISNQKTIIEGHVGTASSSNNIKWNSVAKELYNAINIILLNWAIIPNGTMQDILITIVENPSKQPAKQYIKSVNTIISGDKKKSSLPDMAANLKARHSGFKNYSFLELHKILTDQYPEAKSNYK